MMGMLVMLNNYFHDFATALFVVATYGMWLIVKYADKSGCADIRRMAVNFYPRMVHVAGGSFIFLMFAGVIRTFMYKQYEWNTAVEHGQVEALMVKHVLLFVLFFLGVWLWVKVHRKVRAYRTDIL
ncbi:MAG: hypothetical protein OEV59_01430 [Deltaproteobacteria bacterium]|nr:hypothetical protein [Deltaproteobacteria bacterium]